MGEPAEGAAEGAAARAEVRLMERKRWLEKRWLIDDVDLEALEEERQLLEVH